ncbi:SPRY domain-containing protein [Azospirillum griseum]|uniref:B30.2/SPRY domain-containing protein n=1 Tax=Azospirillum griseum TaxID=2496639 RepID=A0A3S0HUI1_9PROT|nr:SPRY domain-containing protein [Azospirillum griseum]RTR16158.1 hypothetical protein EJ903_21425 [Azospirillum griseum]
MPIIKDRVKQTTTSTGTGTVALTGMVQGFQTFAQAFPSGTQVYYCIADGTDWEVGIGTFTVGSPGSLSRDTVLDSSNAKSVVNWAVGTKDVFVTLPAAAVVGGLFASVAAKAADYTVSASDARTLIECTTSLTLSLTAATSLGGGFTFGVRNGGVGSVTIDPSGSETVNGALTITLAPGDWAILTCSGTAWSALKQYALSASSEMWSSSDKETNLTLANGNLTASVSGSTMQSGRAGVALSGKRYFEVRLDAAAPSGLSAIIGIATATVVFSNNWGLAAASGSAGFASDTGQKLTNSTGVAFGSTWTMGDVIGVATDDSSGADVKIWFSKNGIWQGGGNPAAGANPAFSLSVGTYYPAVTCKSGGQVSARFTGTLWSYSAPSGFSAIP